MEVGGHAPIKAKGQKKRTSNFHLRVGRKLRKGEGTECHLKGFGTSKKARKERTGRRESGVKSQVALLHRGEQQALLKGNPAPL